LELGKLQAKGHQEPQLTDDEQAVLEAIESYGPIMGKGICNRTGVNQSHLTSRIIPKLKEKCGVINRPGGGYYIDK